MEEIKDVSYIGRPRSGTAMFLVKKIEYLIDNLNMVEGCLVFIDEAINIPAELFYKHRFIRSKKPQIEYSVFVNEIYEERLKEERRRKYVQMKGGYYLGENVRLGRNVYIAPGCVIGHDVMIGDNAELEENSVVKHAIIGDDFILREGAIIGGNGFTLTKDDNNNWFRTPSVGNVVIGNDVEIGMSSCVARGTADATQIDDYVKLDALVYVGHDAHLAKNTEISAGGIVGGYVEMQEHVSVGFNACIRNRICIGEKSVVGMGTTVVKEVMDGAVVIGNPARDMQA